MKTQKVLVLEMLQRGGNVTPETVRVRVGSIRLSDLIFKLRNDGWGINTIPLVIDTRRGLATVAKYEFNEGQKQHPLTPVFTPKKR